MKFVSRKVSEFADIHLGGTPSTSQAKYWNGDIPWITPKDMSRHDGIYISGGERYITDRGLQESSAQLLPADTVILSTRAPVGYVAVAGGALATNQGCKNLQCKKGIAHPIFIYYLLKKSTSLLEANATGSTYKELSTLRLKNIVFDLPESIADQARIASILSAYDNLIENNRRRITLLEQAAHLLYKEWFVKPCPHNTPPEGWEQKTLGNVLVALESGGRPKGGSCEQGVPSIGAENIIGIGKYDYGKEKYIPQEYFDSMSKGILQNRDVLIYKDGANIGRSSYFGDGFPHAECAVNEHVFILRAVPAVGQNFLYFWVAQDETRQQIVNLNANTAQPGVSQKTLKTLKLIQPPEQLVRKFNNTIEPTVRQIFNLAKANFKLTEARDLLLPRLMRGEMF